MKEKLGILGGMGPLVSAEFLKTVYESASTEYEQDAPCCIVLSDPSVVDRTRAIFDGDQQRLADVLCRSLEQLELMGANRFVITCITMHAVLSYVPLVLRNRVISLVDVIFDLLETSPNETHLLLRTHGTRISRVFEQHPQWNRLKDRIVKPSEKDQCKIHDLIYSTLKTNQFSDQHEASLIRLAEKYHVKSIITGCTEFHLLHRQFGPEAGSVVGTIDPLRQIAKHLNDYL